MKNSRTVARAVCAVAVLIVGVVAGGCSSEPKPTTKSEEASFKGGPMPPEARAKMEAAIQAAKDKSQQAKPQ